MEKETPKDLLRVTTADGKYTVVVDATGRLTALRYGEPWRDCTGDKLILALASELEEARKILIAARLDIESYHVDWARLNSQSPDYDPSYCPEFPEIVKRISEHLPKTP